jgi:hypothetical protein
MPWLEHGEAQMSGGLHHENGGRMYATKYSPIVHFAVLNRTVCVATYVSAEWLIGSAYSIA